jgi:hypothetical protein
MSGVVVVGRGLLVRAGLGHIDVLFEIDNEGSEVVRGEERNSGGWRCRWWNERYEWSNPRR